MISGRVPTTVTTLSFFIAVSCSYSGFGADWPSIGIGVFTIKDFVSPQHHDHLVLAYVGDVMRPTRDSFANFRPLSGGEHFVELTSQDMPKTETGLALDDQEFFRLGMMVMPTTGNTGMSRKKGELPRIPGFEHFHEDAAWITIPGHLVSEALGWQVAQISGIQRSDQTATYRLGDHGLAAITEGIQLLGQLANRNAVLRFNTDERLPGQLAIHDRNELTDHIIDVDEIDTRGGIIDLDWQVTRDVMTEGRHCRVVIWSCPFSE